MTKTLKPRLRFDKRIDMWTCYSSDRWGNGWGSTPEEAYRNWTKLSTTQQVAQKLVKSINSKSGNLIIVEEHSVQVSWLDKIKGWFK